MRPRLPPYKGPPTPIATGFLESMYRQWHSPHAQALSEAAALIAGGQALKAALLLRQVLRTMEDDGVNPYEREPVLSLSAVAWSRAALRFASSSADYTAGVSQRMRIDFLLESLADYMVLEDVPNQIRIQRAIATAHLSGDRPNAAVEVLGKAFELARTHLVLQAREMQQLFSEMATANKAAFDRQPKAKPDMAIRAAAFHQLTGESTQALVYLGKAHDRLLGIALDAHQLKQDHKAVAFLAQAVVLGIAAGREEMLVRNADLLLQYAILDGDKESTRIYDRAIRMAQSGMREMADRVIQGRAQVILDRTVSRHALVVFHGVVDLGVECLASIAKTSPKVLDAAWALMDAAYWKDDAWRRTLDMLEPFLGEPFVEHMWRDGLAKLRAASAEHELALNLAARHYRVARLQLNAASPALANLVAVAELGYPEALQLIYMQIARDMNCSMAAAESVFTPYGDARLRGRLREALGELTFVHLRSKAMLHDLNARQGRWDTFIRENRGKK